MATEQPKYYFRWVLSKKAILLAVILGVLAGLGSLVFFVMLQLSTKILLGFAGYSPPIPPGEKEFVDLGFEIPGCRYLIIIIPALGGLVSGIITYKWAPEAEGDGTDAVIEAFHWKRGIIRGRIPVIKAVTASILIGSGGSSGREGPISQIGGGVASILAMKLGLSEREREILVVSGMAAGIGSIFKSPFGGSIFGIEVLYKRDYEVQALVPAVISTFVAYIVFGSIVGWRPIFSVPEYSFSPYQLPLFATLGIIAGLVARFYIWSYGSINKAFNRVNIPRYLKPAIGGLLVGLIGFWLPQALETGYGWIEIAILGKLTLEILIIVMIAKIFATAFSVGSGGPGGLFAPSVVVGGFLGGVVGSIFRIMAPELAGDVGVYIIVGMGCFFAAAANVPLASIIMVAEMTGDYNILPPAFLASILAYLVSGERSIYEKQVEEQFRSPFHEREIVTGLLSYLKVKRIAVPDTHVVSVNDSVIKAEEIMRKHERLALPVLDEDGKYVGIITAMDIMAVPPEKIRETKVKDFVRCKFIFVTPECSLLDALYKMLRFEIPELPVIDRETKSLVGEISLRDILKYFHYRAEEYFRELKMKISTSG